MVEPFVAQSKSQYAYDLIRGRIDSFEILPGDRLVLSQLAADLDVSVVPIREAIRRLEAEGIVFYEKNVGARVVSIDREEYLSTMQALTIVEAAATAITAPVMTAERIAEAQAVNERIAANFERFDPVEYSQLNQQFHQLLTIDCPNHYLRDLVDDAWAKIARVRDATAFFTRQRATESVREHDHILALLTRGAPADEIEAAVRAHRTATRDAVLLGGE